MVSTTLHKVIKLDHAQSIDAQSALCTIWFLLLSTPLCFVHNLDAVPKIDIYILHSVTAYQNLEQIYNQIRSSQIAYVCALHNRNVLRQQR
jgi:MFS-type transporter involved in bile tolerance (Atg22 family)